MLKKLFSHSLLYAIGPQIPRIISIFILPLTTAYLTAEDYGTSAVLMAYTGAIAALKDLGLLVLLVNYFFQRKNTWPLLWRRLYGYIIAWSPFYIILQSLVIYAALPNSQMHNYWSIMVMYAFTNLLFDIPIMFGSRFLQLSQKPLPIAIASASAGTIGIMLNLLTIVYFKMGYMGWIVSTFLSSFVLFLFYSYFTFCKLRLYPIFKYQFNHVRSLLKISLPTIPHIYSTYLLNSSDRAILNFYQVPLNSIGKYNLAYSFGSYFEVFITAVGMAVGPIYAKLFSSNKYNKHELARHLTFLLQSTFIVIVFIIAIWMKEIFNFLISNEELKSSYTLSVVILLAYVYKPFYWSSGQLLIFFKRTSKLWRITLVGGIISVFLNIILIPYLGLWSAVLSSYTSLLFIGFYGGFLKETKSLGRLNHFEWYWLLLIVFLTCMALFIVEQPYFIKIVITLSVLILLYLYTKKHIKVLKEVS